MALPFVVDITALNGTNGHILQGAATGDATGAAVDVIGDFNGDGLPDYVVGAYLADQSGRVDAGAAYIVFGTSAVRPASAPLSSLDGSNGFRIGGAPAGAILGWSVAAAGDVNRDGFDDVLIGVPGAGNFIGAAYLLFGKAGGFAATLDVSALTPSQGVALTGPQTKTHIGISVGPAGDFNGDGYADFVIGGNAAPNGAFTGSAYLVFGRAQLPASLDLTSLTPTQGFAFAGLAANDELGWFVNTPGDLNGDGLSDIVIASPAADPLSRLSAASDYVVFGRTTPLPAGFSLNDLNGVNGFRIDGAAQGDQAYKVVGIGDINGDGRGDFAVGAESANGPGRIDAGKVYVLYGRTGAWPATLDLATLAPQVGFQILGAAANNFVGDWIDGAGDVNGDGFDDLLIGAGGFEGGRGAVYLIYGRDGGFAADLDLANFSAADGVRFAPNTGDLLFTGSGGDLNGDGLADVVLGAENLGPGSPTGPGKVYVVYGQSSTAATTGADAWTGTAGADRWKSLGGADTLQGLAGDDRLDGGPGADKALYAGAAGQYDFWEAPDGSWRVKDLRAGGPEGVDTLLSVESLQFGDKTVKILGLTTAEQLTAGYENILRSTATGSELAFLNGLIAAVDGSTKTLAAAITEIVGKADQTTAVAAMSYQFFLNFVPSKGGFDYLVSPQGPNPNNINSAYYQSFNIENRYINFAVNLGKAGEGAPSFLAEYGAKTLFQATKDAYMEIFGGTVVDSKINTILDSSVGSMSRAQYFALYGGDGLTGIGTKAAMVGWLLTEAAKADLGMYANSSNAFLTDLADGAQTLVDVVGTYGEAEYIFNG